MSSAELIAHELRAARPLAPSELRERVRALPEPVSARPLPRPSLRTALALAGACAAAAVAAAVIHGVVTSGSGGSRQVAHGAPTVIERNPPRAGAPVPNGADKSFSQELSPRAVTQLPPNRSRLQQYDIWMRIGVKNLDDLSSRTKAAMQTARRLGGYVASAQYNAPGGRRGESRLLLRIPVRRLNDAIGALSGLGTILAQRLSIEDVQRQVDVQSRTIRRLKKEAAHLRAEIAATTDPAERERLQEQLGYVVAQVEALQRQRAQTVKNARLARVSVVLTTKKAAVAPAHRSRLGRTLDDAGSVLGCEGEVLLYALIVAGPLLLLAAAVLAAARTWNRRADRRLLERA